jgi:hypothetical protein
MKIKMLTPIMGTVESIYENVLPDDVIDVDPVKAAGWISLKWAADVDQSTPITARCLRDPNARAHY